MKIRSVQSNNRARRFEVKTASSVWRFPFTRCDPAPAAGDPVVEATVDRELGCEGFVYTLLSGRTGTVHIEQVLEYNEDPGYLRDILLHQLTVQAVRRIEQSSLSKREIVRRLGTSAAQLYRLLDTTNRRKTIDQMLRLLHVLDCDVQLHVRARKRTA